MATFDPTGSTLQSVTLEAAVMEISQLLQDAESAEGENNNNMSVNYFTGDNTVQIQAVMPIEQTVSSTGEIQFVGVNYIPTTTWTAGGDVKSTNLAAACLEMFQKLQIEEKSLVSNPNNITVTYDTETLLATINAEFSVEFQVDAPTGNVRIIAVPYLAD